MTNPAPHVQTTAHDVLDALRFRYPDTVFEPPYPVQLRGARRDHLPGLFDDLGFRRGAEIGVWEGEYSEKLCAANTDLHLICVDPWLAYGDYADHRSHERIAAAYRTAQTRLAPWSCTFLRQHSVRAAEHVQDGSLDFVYIDGNHRFEYVVADLAAWVPKVRSGGVIAGHDYKSIRSHPELRVVEALAGWTASYEVAPWFILGRERALPSENRDKYRSWLWAKP